MELGKRWGWQYAAERYKLVGWLKRGRVVRRGFPCRSSDETTNRIEGAGGRGRAGNGGGRWGGQQTLSFARSFRWVGVAGFRWVGVAGRDRRVIGGVCETGCTT